MKKKGGRPIGPDPRKVELILRILKTYKDGIWLRNLAKETGLPLSTVVYYIDRFLDYFIENLGYRDASGRFIGIRIVKLKPDKENVTTSDILHYWAVKRRIRDVS
jgi:hypothetical protein